METGAVCFLSARILKQERSLGSTLALLHYLLFRNWALFVERLSPSFLTGYLTSFFCLLFS